MSGHMDDFAACPPADDPVRFRCPECEKLYPGGVRPEHYGSDPKCAFRIDGSFNPDNWQCGTMNKLRAIAARDEREIYNDDSFSAILSVDSDDERESCFVLLAWYKQRGRTDRAWVFTEDTETPWPLTLALAELLIAQDEAWRKRR